MKRRIVILCIIACFMGTVYAQSKVDITEANKLLQLAEDNTAFYNTDFSANYSVVQDKPGEGLNSIDAIMYRRDSQSKWTILITGPQNDKGKGYLQFDSNVWFYDPADGRFTFSSARDKFRNTNANNSDFAPQHYARDYEITTTENVMLGKLDCILFILKAKVNDVDYPQLKLWVTKDDGLVRKKEDYSLSGQLLRTTAVPSYQKVSNNGKTSYLPVKMLIVDNLRGKKISGKMQNEKTQITISNVSFVKQDDIVYTKPYLEMMSTK